jgi:DNA primase
MDEEEVRREVLRVNARPGRGRPAQPEPESAAVKKKQLLPEPRDRLLATERETAKLMIQAPHLFGPGWDGLTVNDFTHPAYAALFTSVEKALASGEPAGEPVNWVHRVSAAADEDHIRSLVAALAVEPLPVHGELTVRFAVAHSAGLRLLSVMRKITELKSKLQRTNPVESAPAYNQMFSELVVLEARRKELRALSIGALD